MKKILVLSIVFAFAFVMNTDAQCTTCGATQQQSVPVFTPKVFTPSLVGIETTGYAYVEYVPMSGKKLRAIVYMYTYGIDVNGNKVITGTTTKGVEGNLIHNRPGHWPDVFEIDGSFDPLTRKYYTPIEISFIYSPSYVRDDRGNVIAIQEVVTF